MGYSFELLTEDFSATYIQHTVAALEARMRDGWPCWAISNHDVERVVSRWGGEHAPAFLANQLTALVCSLRGSVCVYQGEELGLPEADVPYEQLRDPYGIAFWPGFKGRDGCRTPMPWNQDKYAGFSLATPWLPVSDAHRMLAVVRQEGDPGSTLNGFRRFMAWRRTQPVLRWRDIHMLHTTAPLLAFTRSLGADTLLVCFNLAPEAIEARLPVAAPIERLDVGQLVQGRASATRLHLPGYAALFARVLA